MISQDVVEWGKPLQQAVRETPTPHGIGSLSWVLAGSD
jgi:hypothetical protein